jgi:predicted alpha-1,6-mannanase (GH76 family)
MTSRSDDLGGPRPQRRNNSPADRNAEPTIVTWSERADMAEAAIVSRHLRRLWCLPGTELGVVAWPATRRDRLFQSWDYWWQAHLIDCAVDAANRHVTPTRHKRIGALARAMHIRNMGGWTNNYYDDMAWLAIALERAERTQGSTEVHAGVIALERALAAGWQAQIGALPWRKGSDYYNTPANGPAAIALARFGQYTRAQEIADWLDTTLRDAATGLIHDGIHLPSGQLETPIYSYCQGVVLGLETELAAHTGEIRHVERVQRLVAAVEQNLTAGGVITGGGGGDGGLFNGILARYLALVAVMLPGDGSDQVAARRTAATIVQASARSAWQHRLMVEGEPLFGHNWTRAAQLPTAGSSQGTFTAGTVTSSSIPERDLSVQLSGWLLMESAYVVTAAGL